MHVQLKAATGRWFASHFKIRSPPLFSVCLFDSLPEWFFFLSFSFSLALSIPGTQLCLWVAILSLTVWMTGWVDAEYGPKWMNDGQGYESSIAKDNCMSECNGWERGMNGHPNEWMAEWMNEWPSFREWEEEEEKEAEGRSNDIQYMHTWTWTSD